jgi:hypothetical protein
VARGLSGTDRRRARRLPPEVTPWNRLALLRPGQEVRVVNVSRGGASLESSTRMLPGARTELQLSGPSRLMVRGRIAWCRVARLDPVVYQGAIAFDEALLWSALAIVSGGSE